MAQDVADHKTFFFAEKDRKGTLIEYHRAIDGALRLVPDKDDLARLAEDYKGMVEDGLLLDDAESFEKLMQHCQAIQDRANSRDK